MTGGVSVCPESSNMVNIKNRLNGLLYKKNNSFHPLPEWGKLYVKLGRFFNQFISHDTRLIISLAIPVRTFCASLISLGFIASSANKIDQNGYLVYAEYLKSLPKGTPVILRSQTGKRFKGIFYGCVQRQSQIYFTIKTDEKNRLFHQHISRPSRQ